MSTDKVAVITGAGRGMGAAIARELAGNGYAVAVMSPSGAAEALGKELGGIGMAGLRHQRLRSAPQAPDCTMERSPWGTYG